MFPPETNSAKFLAKIRYQGAERACNKQQAILKGGGNQMSYSIPKKQYSINYNALVQDSIRVPERKKSQFTNKIKID